jgi:hypothetical protein
MQMNKRNTAENDGRAEGSCEVDIAKSDIISQSSLPIDVSLVITTICVRYGV